MTYLKPSNKDKSSDLAPLIPNQTSPSSTQYVRLAEGKLTPEEALRKIQQNLMTTA
ncbi:hypothetical protein BGX27_011051 [Mortierella sp. AM989]|nr:hypothetical protein BGX27_011051 [Mortierella sp. AM989]